MAASKSDLFWSFVWYVKHNRFKSVDSMSEDDFDRIAEGFARENVADITDVTAEANRPLGSEFDSVEWPGGVSAYRDRATCDQADYFEGHGKKEVYGA